ncbi:MAG: BlaI/MecI/CopY family transcriptional regulator [Chitinophagaceae bacterium]
MTKLAKAEEQLMELIWQQEKVFLKDLIEAHPDPKPAATTVATLLKRMQDKGFVGYELLGNSRRYFALVNKDDYFSKHIGDMVKDYFGDSALQFASFFTSNANLSTDELEELKKIINQEIKKKKK